MVSSIPVSDAARDFQQPLRRHPRTWPAQQGETALAVEVLKRMIRIAKPVSIRAG
jgi:hypothetical protein